ncbi:MAG: hypothetical protein ACOH5I_13975 [Oligoflexus sp.]
MILIWMFLAFKPIPAEMQKPVTDQVQVQVQVNFLRYDQATIIHQNHEQVMTAGNSLVFSDRWHFQLKYLHRHCMFPFDRDCRILIA